MPNVSFVVSAKDNLSATIKSMTEVINGFSKDAEKTEQKLIVLNKSKSEIKIDTDKAHKALEKLEKQYKKTGDAATKSKRDIAEVNYNTLNEKLGDVTQEIATTEKRKSRQSAREDMAQGMLTEQIFQDAVQIVGQAGQYYSNSMYGAETGNVASNAISSAATYGGLVLMMTGNPVFALAAGSIGALVGGIRGAIENAQNRDDAFKDVVVSEYERVTQLQDAMLQSGSTIAAQRETDSRASRLYEAELSGDKKRIKEAIQFAVDSPTFTELTSKMEAFNNEVSAAAGAGYNNVRGAFYKEQLSTNQEDLGMMQAAQVKIGEYKASQENERDRILIEKTKEAYAIIEAQNLQGDEAGRLLLEAQVEAENEYRKSDGYQLYAKGEKEMVEHLQKELADGWKHYGYEMGLQFSKGLESARTETEEQQLPSYVTGKSAAFGMNYVPYDNFPAMLHQGERVLTASQARAADHVGNRPPVTITGNTFHVREEADINRIAAELANNIVKARAIYGG